VAPAKSIAQMQQVFLNDRIDAGLAMIFMVVVVTVFVLGVRTAWQALRANAPSTHEAPYVTTNETAVAGH